MLETSNYQHEYNTFTSVSQFSSLFALFLRKPQSKSSGELHSQLWENGLLHQCCPPDPAQTTSGEDARQYAEIKNLYCLYVAVRG